MIDENYLESVYNLHCDLPKFRIGVLLNDQLLRWYNIRHIHDFCDAVLDASKLVSEKDFSYITWITDFQI